MENQYYGGYPSGGYPGYEPYGYPPGRELFAVQPAEKKALKKQYAGTFAMALIHGIGSFILAQVLFIALGLSGYEFRYTDDNTAIIDWQYEICGSLPSILFGIGIFLFEMLRSRTPLSEYFRTDRISGAFVPGYFGVLVFSYAAAIILQNILITGMFSAGFSPISEDYLSESDITPEYLIATVIFSMILAPIAEELLFRGVILRRLSVISQKFAIFASAAIFGMMHGNFLQAVLGFIVGIVLGYTAVKTGSLVLCIAGHMFINTVASSSEFVEYFFDEETSASYYNVIIILFLLIGLVSVIAAAVKGSIRFPEYTEYHSKRTFPVIVTCVSFWIMMIYYVTDILSKFGPVTDKLLE